MKHRTALAALAAIAAAALVLPSSPAAAQDGTNLFVVHGWDADLADNDRVTVCDGDEPLVELQGGNVAELPDQQGPLELTVWLGSNSDCDAEDDVGLLIGPDEFTPQGAAQALVITVVDEDSTGGIEPFDLDVECTDEGAATVSVLHASAQAGPVFAQLDEVNLPGSPLEYGQDAVAEVEAGTYDFGLSATEDPADETVEVVLPTATNTVLAVVGEEQFDTVDVIQFPVPVGVCDDPDGPGPDPDGPDPDAADPAADGPMPAPAGPTPVPAAERPLALTG